MKTRVKVCGIRRIEDARLAVDLGAWALGFIFHRPSPRYVEPEEAAGIISALDTGVLTVGVFVDRPLDEVNRLVETVGLGAVQLHGDEDPGYARKVRAGEVWKALRVGEGFEMQTVDDFRASTRILLDTYRRDAAGGTGETFDWEVARRVQERRPVLLAGGLRPDNIEEALEKVRPEGVDVSGGVEERPGVKDAARMREFFAAVARHDGTEARGGASG